MTVVVIGLVCAALVFLVDRLGDIFQVSLTLHGVTSGAMLGIFTLGMLVPWSTTKGAIVGGLSSMLFMIWLIVGAQINMAQKRLFYEPLPTSNDKCLNVESLFNQTMHKIDPGVDGTRWKTIHSVHDILYVLRLNRVSDSYGCGNDGELYLRRSQFTKRRQEPLSADYSEVRRFGSTSYCV